MDTGQHKLARRQLRGLLGSIFPVPRLVADRTNETVVRRILLQPFIDLVASIEHVVACVEIKRLAVLMIRSAGRRGFIALMNLEKMKQLSLTLECAEGAVN